MEETQKDILSSTLQQFATKLSTPAAWFFTKPKKIKLIDLNSNKVNLNDVRDVIYKLLDKDILFNTDQNLIIFHSLKCFNFKKNTINISEPVSIENGCKKILKLFGIFNKGDDFLSTYFSEILDLEKLPYFEKLKLEKIVKNDLKTIDDLIKSYEHEKCVIAFKSENQKPRKQMERVYIEFYKRCLNEKEKMVNYLIHELEDRAIQFSKISPLPRSLHLSWLIFPPYRHLIKRNIEHFDWKKINKCRHKIPNDLIIKESNYLESIYNEGRYKLFYSKLNKILPLDKLFKNINNRISKFPELSNRKKIITELEYLFRKKKWYGFYALALTQVEGIFFEMVELVYNENKGFSLPDKVNALRKYYRYHEYTFDYYEFYLPNQRNRFFHTGKITNLTYKSYGLLYDLNTLLNIFYELDTPLVELSNFIDRENVEDFKDIVYFNHFYDLIYFVKQKDQYEQIEIRLNDFINNFILSKVDLMTIYIKLYYEIKISFENLFGLLEGYYYKKTKSKINICKSSNDQLMNKLSIFKSIFEDKKYQLKEDIKFLINSDKFLKNTKKILKKIPKDSEIFEKLIKNNFKDHFEKLNLFEHQIKLSESILKPRRLLNINK